LLSDTVGFIRDLPHRLIASFRATLEETRQADLLLHVADASSSLVDHQIAAVRGVLADLGVDDKDTLLVLNKIDTIEDPASRDRVLARYPHALAISARSGTGLPGLARAVSDHLGRAFRDVDIETDPGNGRLLAWLAAHGEVLSRHFTADCMTIHCRIPAALLGRIDPQDAVIHDRATASPSLPDDTPHDDAPAPAIIHG
jgi:GTP-binding protein HflX